MRQQYKFWKTSGFFTKKSFTILGGILAVSLGFWVFAGMISNHFEVPEEGITFHEVHLVCNAVPDIGCGSRSKPVLSALQNEPTIKEAWLNRQGMVTAIVWEKGTAHNVKAVPAIFKKHGLSFKTLKGTDYERELASFKSDRWYKDKEVDELSMEEAAHIAHKIIDPLVADGILTEADASAFHSEVEAYIQHEFLTLEDVSLLNTTEYYDRWEAAIKEMGKKYTPEMPDIEMCGPSSSSCKTGKRIGG